MITELLQIANSLAQRLQRAVEIDDPQMQLIIHSPQFGDVDQERVASILQRRAPGRAVASLMAQGIAEATEPVHVPANPDFGASARVCVPIRHRGGLLGYLWLLDPDCSLSDDQLELAKLAAQSAGRVLYSDSLLVEIERGRERELLRDLLSEQEDFRYQAAEELLSGNLFARGAAVAVLVARYTLAEGRYWDDELRLIITQALDRVRNSIPPRRSLHLVRPDHSVFLVGVFRADDQVGEALSVGRRLFDVLWESLGGSCIRRLVIGVGEADASLERAWHSYDQAKRAAGVAEIANSFGPVVSWRQLGVYGLLEPLIVEGVTKDSLHPGLVSLFEKTQEGWLVPTLEIYLDSGCDVAVTAKQLCIHRASLYRRLRRIEELAGVNLRRGEDRLALHLGLKMARLAGIGPSVKC